jgi:hypothetical protein
MGRVFIGQPANLEFKESKIRAGGQEKTNLDVAFCQHVFVRAEGEMFYRRAGCITDGDWRLEIFWHAGN